MLLPRIWNARKSRLAIQIDDGRAFLFYEVQGGTRMEKEHEGNLRSK